jgi:hypothetical protein
MAKAFLEVLDTEKLRLARINFCFTRGEDFAMPFGRLDFLQQPVLPEKTARRQNQHARRVCSPDQIAPDTAAATAKIGLEASLSFQ